VLPRRPGEVGACRIRTNDRVVVRQPPRCHPRATSSAPRGNQLNSFKPDETVRPTIDVLLVDDNLADVRLTQETFRDVNPAVWLHVAGDGVEAMDFLQRHGDFLAAPRPRLILLDLNLPRKDGRQVLAEIKADPSLRIIPTIVLSMSDSPSDVASTYQLQASAFIKKPLGLADSELILRRINDFWLESVLYP
jgi:CheY-like chemotaxis protein